MRSALGHPNTDVRLRKVLDISLYDGFCHLDCSTFTPAVVNTDRCSSSVARSEDLERWWCQRAILAGQARN